MNIRTAFCCLLLMVLSSGALASANTLLPDLKALALDKLVLDRTDQPVTVIETSPIMTSKDEVAKGMTEIILSLDASAKNSLIIQGKTLVPGSTLSIVQDLTTTNGVIKIPAYPATPGVSSVDGYKIDIPKVTAQLCESDYTYSQTGNTCLKVDTTNVIYTCPGASWKITGDLRNCTQESTVGLDSCPAGFYSNNDGTCFKTEQQTTTAKCKSGYAYNTTKLECEKLDIFPSTKICPTGTTYSSVYNDCRSTQTTSASYGCRSGWTDRGSYCSLTSVYRPNGNTCPSGYLGVPNDTIAFDAHANSNLENNQNKCFKSAASYCANSVNYWQTDYDGNICHTRTIKSVPLTENCPADYPHIAYINGTYSKTCGKATPTEVTSVCPAGTTKVNRGDRCLSTSDFVDMSPQTTELTSNKEYFCPSGWSQNGSSCSLTTSATMADSCPAGATNMNNGNCSIYLLDPVEWVCTSPGYSKLNDSSCEKVTKHNLAGTCPINYIKNGNQCLLSLNAAQIESCPATFFRVGNECKRDVFKAPTCEYGIVNDSSCECPSGTSLNKSTFMCEGIESSALSKTCPTNYTMNGNECHYTHATAIVFDYCPSGMTQSGSNCILNVNIPATESCNSSYSVVSGQCQRTVSIPAGYSRGNLEAKSYIGNLVTEPSTIKLTKNKFDAIVSEVNEFALDVEGGCRLVASELQAKGAIKKGDIPCSVVWNDLPNGLSAKDNKLSGIFPDAGQKVIGYQLVSFSGSANVPFIVADGELIVDVTMPPKPEITDITTRIMNSVVRGFNTYNYDSTSKINLTTALVEPRTYDQVVEIEGVGSCIVSANSPSCNIYSDERFVRDENNLTFTSTYKIWGNSKVGGWDKNELTPKTWKISHDFRGPEIAFTEWNGDKASAPIVNEDFGFPVIVNGGEGAVGIINFRDEVSLEDTWWKPNKVDIEFVSKDGKKSVSMINISGTNVLFDVPQSKEGPLSLTNYKVLNTLNGNVYPFLMSTLTPGVYDVKITAKDAYNNLTVKNLENIKVTTPTPQIKVLNKKSIVNANSRPSVVMIDDFTVVAHNGIVGDTKITSVKIDGRDALATNDDEHFKLLTGEGFNLSANQTYELVVEVEDSKGATTHTTIPFNYLQMEFNFQRKPQTVIQLVEDVGLTVNRTKGLRCDIYGTKAAAALAANETNHTCYVEWSKVPDGMSTESSSFQSVAKGGVSYLGQNTAEFIAYVVNKSGVTSVVSQGEVTFEALPPEPITIKLDERLKLGQDVYSISVLDRQIGRYQGTSSRANVDIDLTTNTGDTKQYKHNQLPFGEIQNFSAYADKLGGAKLWDKVPYTLKGAYRLAPELSTTVNFELVVTPHPYMQVLMDLDDTRYASTEKINATISLGIKNNLTNTFDYSIETMGTGWDVYLAFKKGKDYEPISDAIQIGTNGKGVIQIDADTIFNRNEAVYAVAEARSPYPEVEITRVSIPRSITVVKGTAVDGEIVSRVVHSRIPAAFDLRFDTESFQDFMVMGEIKWQRDVSGSWVDMTELTGRQYVSVKSVEPETIDVRAVITNKETGAVTETETLRLISFDKPKMRIDGVTQAISGQTLELTAVDVSGGVLSDAVYEWSMDGETWEKGFATYNVNVENSSVRVYGRMKYANTSDEIQMDQWATAVKYISVTKPKPITLNVVRPSMAEVDSEIALKMLVSNPFASTGVDLFTEWLLPDGTVIKDQKEITYTLQESDLDSSKRVTLVARSWLDGFKDVTLGQANAVMNTFSYSFPSESDLSLTVNNNVKFVPSSGYATVNMPYINAPGVVFTYDWTFDDTVIKKVSSNGKGMNFNVIQAGVHEIMATVSDNRGNFAHIKNYVEAQKPNDLSFVLNEVYSNKFMRAPLTASIYPNVKVGHPYDFVKEYTWTVNGVKSEPSSRAVGAFNELVEGHYDIILDVKTNFGQVGQTTFSVDVVANKLPTCAPSVRSQYGTYIVDANCKDEDGRITFYKWVVNGMVFSPYGPQVRFTEHDYPNGATITIEANDDAGGKGVGHTSF